MKRACSRLCRRRGSNIVRVGERQARSVLQQGVRQVCQLGRDQTCRTWSRFAQGLLGRGATRARQKVARLLAKSVSGKIEVVSDVVVAHEAALGGAAGVVVISGTGSIAFGRH